MVQGLGPLEVVEIFFELLQFLGTGVAIVHDAELALAVVLGAAHHPRKSGRLDLLHALLHLWLCLSGSNGEQTRVQSHHQMFVIRRHTATQDPATKLPAKLDIPVHRLRVKHLQMSVDRTGQHSALASVREARDRLAEVGKAPCVLARG
ncbi:hypothetical protein OGAPHI_000242 [Ogataea philodendri]|uniref:Uncharacterized protein n=1 Tax=Ogataea philodendri TaxID=1378263 RepID=A0A9P8TAE9_9ASCO|nr:uncharacterized protein OGAPHI_000242 [Ogataea philodendri]KAH3671539.1 hypothetical protein OGAPHI_000242 [Ogataea philodendri]